MVRNAINESTPRRTFGAGAFLRQGTICIFMAALMFLALTILGAILGLMLSRFGPDHEPKLLSLC